MRLVLQSFCHCQFSISIVYDIWDLVGFLSNRKGNFFVSLNYSEFWTSSKYSYFFLLWWWWAEHVCWLNVLKKKPVGYISGLSCFRSQVITSWLLWFLYGKIGLLKFSKFGPSFFWTGTTYGRVGIQSLYDSSASVWRI